MVPSRTASSILVVVLGMASAPARAATLPIASYSIADGLPGNQVRCAVEDAAGFIWFCTNEGLARFDGERFKAFGADRGLADGDVVDLAVTGRGTFAVASRHGAFAFDVRDGGRFEPIAFESASPLREINTVFVAADGNVWYGADGLYRVEGSGAERRLRRAPLPFPDPLNVTTVAEEPGQGLWVVTSRGLCRVDPRSGGSAAEATPNSERRYFTAVTHLPGIGVVAGTSAGLLRREGSAWSTFPAESRFDARVTTLVRRRDGGIWVGSWTELADVAPEGHALRLVDIDPWPGGEVWPFLEDSHGDLWLAPATGGLMRLAADGFVRYTKRDGLTAPHVKTILRSRVGEIVVVGAHHVLQRVRGERIEAAPLALPDTVTDPGWGWDQVDFEARDGSWWIPTGSGLLRYRPPSRLDDLPRARPEILYTERDGLPGRQIFRVYEDRRGDVWVSTIGTTHALSRWDHTTERFVSYAAADGVPEDEAPTAFAEDADGSLWIGFGVGHLVRYRDGRFTSVAGAVPLVGAPIRGIQPERPGVLWIGTAKGLYRLDTAAAAAAAGSGVAAAFGTREGLFANGVRALARDRAGRLYVAFAGAIDLFDPASGAIRRFTAADGMPPGLPTSLFVDPGGTVWIGTNNGLASYAPAAAPPIAPPRLAIDALRIGGVPVPVSAGGDVSVPELDLAPDQRTVEIDLVAVGSSRGRPVRFQHRLAPDQPWSAPTDERSILLAGLSPSRYRFEARAVTTSNGASDSVVVAFRVRAPVWQRPWFLAAVAATGLSLGALAYRARVRRLVGLEHLRTRIAMDLHDEMGSGLASIGVLATVAGGPEVDAVKRADLASRIVETAEELGAAISEIVWSLRPASGTLPALATHVVERASRLFPGDGARVGTALPASWPDVPVSLGVRRNVVLIAVEALHNASRHAGASAVTIGFARRGGRWTMTIEDDGCGFVPPPEAEASRGLGLSSMRKRAAEIGSHVAWEPRPGGGTRVVLEFNPRFEGRRPGRPVA
jgi:signal transduction histidine kinase/ligand-binding sensor domain-containing protein